MHRFDIASRTVLDALQTGQIGTAVAVRVVAHLTADHGPLERFNARIMEATGTWLKSRPERLTAMGNVEAGQISTLNRFVGGQTALVSVGTIGMGQPLLEIVVWGNRGILSWEAGDRFTPTTDRLQEPKLSEHAQNLLRQVRSSLATGGSVEFAKRPADAVPRPADPIHLPLRADRAVPRRPKAQAPPYGVLLVAGDHTHQPGYARALAADKRCRLIGLTDEADVTPRRKRLNAQLADRLGIPFLPNLQQALHREDVQIVSICAEPARRGRIVVQAAKAGKHLYLDKPLAGSLRDADDIQTAVTEAGVVNHMWSQVRSDVAFRMRQTVQSGQLGELTAFHADLCFAKGPAGTASLDKPRQETPVPQRYELTDSKRELSNVGVYPLVSLLWLTGRKVRRVAATTGNYFFKEHQQNNMEDFGQMLLELDGGLVASISVGRTGWRSYRSGGLNRTCLIGTKETVVFDAHRPRIALWADVEPWTAPQRDPEDPMGMWGTPKTEEFTPRPRQSWTLPAGLPRTSDVAYFLDCIEQGRESDALATLAAAATEVLLAGYHSAATGTLVKLPLPRKTQ